MKSLITTLTALVFFIGGTSAEAKKQESKVYGYPVSRLSDFHVGEIKRELRAQVKHSRDVLDFFQQGKGLKMTAFCHPIIGEFYGHCATAQQQREAHGWLLDVSSGRLKSIRAAERRLAEKAAMMRRIQTDPIAAIQYVFGDYAGQALAVASCESGYSVWASNGQYQGIFQMGSHERATYGHGSDPLTQAQAAYRYFVASGRDWSPWECRPY